ncbi:MAG: hypothetical protein DELT_00111 [Desulfovibrio sp.]
MSTGAIGSALDAQAGLTQQLLGGQMAEVDQAVKTAKVAMQMQVKGQEMANTQEAVAMMTGVGTNVNTVV